MSDVNGIRTLVIGATGTIGSAIAEAFDSQGSRLFLHGFRGADSMENLRNRLKSVDGVELSDLTDEGAVQRLFSRVTEAWSGQLDAIVISSGVNPTASRIRDLKLEDWQLTLAVNLTLPFLCVKYALPLLEHGQRRRVVILDSIFGIESPANRGAYGSSKHGLAGLVQSLSREEGGKEGVRINAICPGPLWGPNVHRIFIQHAAKTGLTVEEYVKQRLSKIPGGRFTEPKDVAALAMFLCSEGADYINGQLIRLTGGAIE